MAWMKREVVGMTVLATELWGQSYSGGGNPVDGVVMMVNLALRVLKVTGVKS